jgi:putative ABC transport system ATP-binding protein
MTLRSLWNSARAWRYVAHDPFEGLVLPERDQVELVAQVPLLYAGGNHRRERAQGALEMGGLGDRVHHKPTEMSVGQQQRVAIARALVTNPTLILADEPTGNLDTRASIEIISTFLRLNQEKGISVVFVTHEPDIAAYTRRIITIRDGLVNSDKPNAAMQLENAR